MGVRAARWGRFLPAPSCSLTRGWPAPPHGPASSSFLGGSRGRRWVGGCCKGRYHPGPPQNQAGRTPTQGPSLQGLPVLWSDFRSLF